MKQEHEQIGGLEALAHMEYPGRVIILGRAPGEGIPFVVYGITGRSPSSQARRIVFEGTRAMVTPTDEDLLAEGDPDLLLYAAISIQQGCVVSNGRQTFSIRPIPVSDPGPVEVLAQGLEGWDFEPDPPNWTPRISGCVLTADRGALSIIKHGGGGLSVKNYFEFPLLPGRAKMISTYTGKNANPLPSFQGEPLDLHFRGVTARQTAEAVYAAMAPADPKLDFRVAAACVFLHDLQRDGFEKAVINRHDRNSDQQSLRGKEGP
jgi:IMP cyclohydrolase